MVKNSPSNAGDMGSNPDRELISPTAGQLSVRAVTTESTCSRPCAPQLEKACIPQGEPTCCNDDPAQPK